MVPEEPETVTQTPLNARPLGAQEQKGEPWFAHHGSAPLAAPRPPFPGRKRKTEGKEKRREEERLEGEGRKGVREREKGFFLPGKENECRHEV